MEGVQLTGTPFCTCAVRPKLLKEKDHDNMVKLAR